MKARTNLLALAAGAAISLASAGQALADRAGSEIQAPRDDQYNNVRVLDQKEMDAEHLGRSSSYSFDPFNLVVGDTLSTTFLNVSGVPGGTYTSYSLTVDWSAVGGDPWSSEARFGLWDTNASAYLNTSFIPSNGQNNGNPITLNWSGSFAFNYNGGDSLEFDALQTFAGSSANWNNINLTLNTIGSGPSLSDLSISTLTAGSVVMGNNGGSADELNGSLGFGSGSWSGGDDVYTLDWAGGDLDLQLLFSHAEGDLDLFLWGNDSATNLLGSATSISDNEFISISALAAGTYWIHIDGWLGDSADYTLVVIPTPGALALFGVAGLAAVRRRR